MCSVENNLCFIHPLLELNSISNKSPGLILEMAFSETKKEEEIKIKKSA